MAIKYLDEITVAEALLYPDSVVCLLGSSEHIRIHDGGRWARPKMQPEAPTGRVLNQLVRVLEVGVGKTTPSQLTKGAVLDIATARRIVGLRCKHYAGKLGSSRGYVHPDEMVVGHGGVLLSPTTGQEVRFTGEYVTVTAGYGTAAPAPVANTALMEVTPPAGCGEPGYRYYEKPAGPLAAGEDLVAGHVRRPFYYSRCDQPYWWRPLPADTPVGTGHMLIRVKEPTKTAFGPDFFQRMSFSSHLARQEPAGNKLPALVSAAPEFRSGRYVHEGVEVVVFRAEDVTFIPHSTPLVDAWVLPDHPKRAVSTWGSRTFYKDKRTTGLVWAQRATEHEKLLTKYRPAEDQLRGGFLALANVAVCCAEADQLRRFLASWTPTTARMPMPSPRSTIFTDGRPSNWRDTLSTGLVTVVRLLKQYARSRYAPQQDEVEISQRLMRAVLKA